MKRIIETRKRLIDGLTTEEIDQLDETSFGFYESDNGKPEYFPASIIQRYDCDGNTINDLRIFTEALSTPDVRIPEESIIGSIKSRPHHKTKAMY